MKKVLSIVAVLAIAVPSFGHPGRHPHRHGRGPGPVGLLSIGATTGASLAALSSHHEYKMAILDGEEAALQVLDGAPANDLFVNAKNVAEVVLNVQFGNEQEAALAILDLNQSLAEEEAQ